MFQVVDILYYINKIFFALFILLHVFLRIDIIDVH